MRSHSNEAGPCHCNVHSNQCTLQHRTVRGDAFAGRPQALRRTTGRASSMSVKESCRRAGRLR
eukprot:3166409-Rhodomonas_salina.1